MAYKQPGKIITFYSYKGGTGRTMALANMAWVLASNGKQVLVVDWDLEAPGLHRFLHPFLDDKTLASSEGVIDLVIDFATEALTPRKNPQERLPDDWYVQYADILRYARSLNWEFFDPSGTLDFIPAGRQDSAYSTRVNAFDWQTFYERLGGYWFIEAAKARMKAEYDYILIDSRTGISDTSGICTVQLPDILVVCFTMNNQSIEGAAAIAKSVDDQRRSEDRRSGIRIFPVPTRVELGEKERLNVAREAARSRFAPFLWHIDKDLDPAKLDDYWGQVEIIYEPFYAYEEILAAFADQPQQTTSLLASSERLTSYVTGEETRLVSPPESQRQLIFDQYTRQRLVSPTADQYIFYLSYARNDQSPYLDQFYRDLSREVRLLMGLPTGATVGFWDRGSVEPGDVWPEELARALQRSRVLVPLFSPGYFRSEYCGKEYQYFLERRSAKSSPQASPQILPVLWVSPRSPMPKQAAVIQLFDPDFPKIYQQEGLHFMMRLRRFQDDYHEFCAYFAQRLVELAQRSDMPNPPPPRLEELPSAFERL